MLYERCFSTFIYHVERERERNNAPKKVVMSFISMDSEGWSPCQGLQSGKVRDVHHSHRGYIIMPEVFILQGSFEDDSLIYVSVT